ncbi:MAG: ATP-dependent RecD-like DNA helicase [Clostridia bacterium]|nr:ATP-dependent RecD-like DNA helicase [Clostridia bacterium]
METIRATAEDVVYRNEENGYTVLIVKSGKNRLSAIGVMPEVAEGEQLELEGSWQDHPVYGRQFRVSSAKVQAPTTLTAVERFLASGLIRGIGPATAKLIVRTFGKDALDIMASDPERLLEVPGLGRKKVAMIAESYAQHHQQQETLLLLQEYHISPSLAMKIYKRYGDDVREILKNNPYRLVDDIEGVGFRTADQIAVAAGIDRNSEFRISSGIRYLIREASSAGGHCYLPREKLIAESMRVLGCSEELAQHTLDSLILGGGVKAEVLQEDDQAEFVAVYDPYVWQAEQETALRLIRLLEADGGDGYTDKEIEDSIEAVQALEGLSFHEAQKQAVRLAVQSRVSVITGGPGTGKTTIIKCILHTLGAGASVALAAPTGRAAKRMSEACGAEAKTIHRLLEYNGEGGMFLRGKNHPLEVDNIIVDEMSMVDIFLMRSLLYAIPAGARLILVGDADQLPSVGAGNVLRDILKSGQIPSVCLSEIFRQDEKSMIVYNAHCINRGEMPKLNAKDGDFYFERAATPQDAVSKVLALCESRLPSFLGLDSVRQIQVLSPAKKGECGVWELNRRLQQSYNPPEKGKAEKLRGETLFRVGDKVMQTKNNYELQWKREGIFGWEEGEGVFNGDIGYIKEIDNEDATVTVLFDDDRLTVYEGDDIEDLELAYCISIHKSQGSEFPVVVMPVMGGPPMLMNRNLFYTAVTRAKKFVMLVGREAVIEQMVTNTYVRQRYTALDRRIRAVCGREA